MRRSAPAPLGAPPLKGTPSTTSTAGESCALGGALLFDNLKMMVKVFVERQALAGRLIGLGTLVIPYATAVWTGRHPAAVQNNSDRA